MKVITSMLTRELAGREETDHKYDQHTVTK